MRPPIPFSHSFQRTPEGPYFANCLQKTPDGGRCGKVEIKNAQTREVKNHFRAEGTCPKCNHKVGVMVGRVRKLPPRASGQERPGQEGPD